MTIAVRSPVVTLSFAGIASASIASPQVTAHFEREGFDMGTLPERQAADVCYLGAVYSLPGSATAVTFAVPDAWKGKMVDFSFIDTAAPTNIAYILFGNAVVGNTSALAASTAPTDSAITGAELSIAPVTTSSGSHIQIPSGQARPVRIDSDCAFISHIEVAGTGKLRMTLSTGDGS